MEFINTILNGFCLVLLVVLLMKTKAKTLPEKPIKLMNNSKINSAALKKAGISVDELMSSARCEGYFNLGDIDTAILEPNGKISFLPQPMKRALNPKDFNFAPVREGVCTTVIKDGVVLEENLKKSGVSREAFFNLLEQRGESVKDILIATVNEAGRVDFFSR